MSDGRGTAGKAGRGTTGMNDRRSWAAGVRTGVSSLILSGVVVVGLSTVGFGAWAALAPLAGAAVAPGFVAAAGQNQRVQHLEGGIIDEILVREGDVVGKGQVLFRMEGTMARARSNQLANRSVSLAARAARLVAERDGAETVVFARALRGEAETSGMVDLLDEQEKEFVARLERYRQERVILRQRVTALTEQIEGLSAQKTAVERQLEVVREETSRKMRLLDQGLTDRSEYTALLRSEADLVGQLGQIASSTLASRAQIVEAEEQFSRLQTQRVETAASQLNDVRAEISTTAEEAHAAQEVLKRIDVRAPSDGIVVTMPYNTPGSVVKPGEVLLELLPTGDDLLVEVRVAPQDVDVVTVGQAATLRFSALNTRTTPTVPATVTYMSADRLIDPATRQPYYSARLRMAGELPAEIEQSRIYPGMPVEAFIRTGDRTFLEYLGKPLADSFSRAFREE